MLAEQVMVGGCVSLTLTVNTHISGPEPLFEMQVTVDAPTGKTAPLAGAQVTVPQLPEVVGAG